MQTLPLITTPQMTPLPRSNIGIGPITPGLAAIIIDKHSKSTEKYCTWKIPKHHKLCNLLKSGRGKDIFLPGAKRSKKKNRSLWILPQNLIFFWITPPKYTQIYIMPPQICVGWYFQQFSSTRRGIFHPPPKYKIVQTIYRINFLSLWFGHPKLGWGGYAIWGFIIWIIFQTQKYPWMHVLSREKIMPRGFNFWGFSVALKAGVFVGTDVNLRKVVSGGVKAS